MIFDHDPEWVEPSFSIYYFDMVYSHPVVLEIDFLAIFKGALLSIEIEKNLGEIPRKSLKYFVNGACRHPVLYSSGTISSIKSGKLWTQETNISTPTLVSYSVIRCWLKQFLDLENYKYNNIKWKLERNKLFVIDNFMCSLLLYGSPSICNILLKNNNILRHVTDSFELAKFRASLIKKVKLLEDLDCGEVASHEKVPNSASMHQAVDKNQPVRSLILVIPIVRSKFFYAELKRFMKRDDVHNLLSSLEKLVFVYTEDSREDASTIISVFRENLGDKVQLDKMEVKRFEIAKTVRDLAVNHLPKEVLILFIGEVPKRELVKLMDLPPTIRFGTLTWRAIVHENAFEKFIEELGGGGVEEIRLCMVQI